jgi:hypothetical protein
VFARNDEELVCASLAEKPRGAGRQCLHPTFDAVIQPEAKIVTSPFTPIEAEQNAALLDRAFKE